MRLHGLRLAVLCGLSLSACDLLEVPPDVPPPDGVSHPYGEGNGRLAFVSDLAGAVRIDVTVAGESIGSITRFSGCPGTLRGDDGLATAILPAGRYQYTATASSGVVWGPTAVTVEEDEENRQVLLGRPSAYAVHLPATLEGYPVGSYDGSDSFHLTTGASSLQLKVARPSVAQGDRVDVVANGVAVARGVVIGTSDLWFDIDLTPGPNWVAVRLSQDDGNDGGPVRAILYDGETLVGDLWPNTIYSTKWSGANLRYAC